MKMQKVLFTCAVASFFTGLAYAASITFKVEDVLVHTKDSAYNCEYLDSEDGRACIEKSIEMLNAGSVPKGIAHLFGSYYKFQDRDYTKSVIGHFCGSTAHWANQEPQF